MPENDLSLYASHSSSHLSRHSLVSFKPTFLYPVSFFALASVRATKTDGPTFHISISPNHQCTLVSTIPLYMVTSIVAVVQDQD